MRIAVRIFGTLMLVSYPIAVWAGLSMASNRLVGLMLLAALAVFLPLHLLTRRWEHFRGVLGGAVILSVPVLLSVLLDDRRFLLSTPVLVNATLLVGFGLSLLDARMPVIERFARMTHKTMSPERVLHCRWVTKVWCLFFLINGLASLGLALFAPLSMWALYTGVISYVLMGALFAGEYAIRKVRFG
jgi:uncharacterized membrane protein